MTRPTPSQKSAAAGGCGRFGSLGASSRVETLSMLNCQFQEDVITTKWKLDRFLHDDMAQLQSMAPTKSEDCGGKISITLELPALKWQKNKNIILRSQKNLLQVRKCLQNCVRTNYMAEFFVLSLISNLLSEHSETEPRLHS